MPTLPVDHCPSDLAQSWDCPTCVHFHSEVEHPCPCLRDRVECVDPCPTKLAWLTKSNHADFTSPTWPCRGCKAIMPF